MSVLRPAAPTVAGPADSRRASTTSSMAATRGSRPPALADAAEGSTLLFLADPFSSPGRDFLHALRRAAAPDMRGRSAAWRRQPQGPGGNRLVLDGQVVTDGAVGVLLDPARRDGTVVSQGCRPIGEPLIVTKAERNVIYELAGRPRARPPAARCVEQPRTRGPRAGRSGPAPRPRRSTSSKADFGRGDFLDPQRARRRPRGRRDRGRRRGRRRHDRAVPGPRRRRRPTRTCARLLAGAPADGRARVHLQRARHAPLRRARPRRRRRRRARRRRRRSPGCSAPARSVPSAAATSCTASPRRVAALRRLTAVRPSRHRSGRVDGRRR